MKSVSTMVNQRNVLVFGCVCLFVVRWPSFRWNLSIIFLASSYLTRTTATKAIGLPAQDKCTPTAGKSGQAELDAYVCVYVCVAHASYYHLHLLFAPYEQKKLWQEPILYNVYVSYAHADRHCVCVCYILYYNNRPIELVLLNHFCSHKKLPSSWEPSFCIDFMHCSEYN